MAEAILEFFLEIFVDIFGEMVSGLIHNNKRNPTLIKAAKIILIVVTLIFACFVLHWYWFYMRN